ncbi:hypothetical protein V1264_019297 [Littorina saxatilis]|uniref:Uncharacterized protein n=1 Tax=Littorina saxatilis TaxID=31220 RepID=A0AAN9BK02_9CAEN
MFKWKWQDLESENSLWLLLTTFSPLAKVTSSSLILVPIKVQSAVGWDSVQVLCHSSVCSRYTDTASNYYATVQPVVDIYWDSVQVLYHSSVCSGYTGTASRYYVTVQSVVDILGLRPGSMPQFSLQWIYWDCIQVLCHSLCFEDVFSVFVIVGAELSSNL